MTSKILFRAGSRTRFCVAAGACIALLCTMSATVWAAAEGEEGAAAEIVPIKVFVPGPLRMDQDTDLSINEMERRLNIDLQIVGGPWDQVWSKLNLMMASGDPLDIMHVSNQGQNPWQQWAEEGLIANLDDHVTPEKYPFIHKVMTADMFKPLTIDGGHYYVPGTHHGYDWQFHIRQDWLDNLGLAMPHTPDELYEVLKAFSDDDPDGNGKDDTTGFVTSAATGVGAPIFMAFNASANIKDMEVQEDGSVISLAAHQGTLEALKFGNRLYREGALNTDFINHPNNEEASNAWIYSNRGGAFFAPVAYVTPNRVERIGVPEAAFDSPDPPVVAPGYKLNGAGVSWWLLLGVSADSKYIDKSLEVIEFANSREGRQLFVAGIEDRHWSNMVDGIYDLDFEQWQQDYDVELVNKSWPRWWGFFSTVHGYIPINDYPTFEEAMANVEVWANREDYEAGGSAVQRINEAKPLVRPNPMDLVTLAEVEDIRVNLDENVRAPLFAKMLIADSEAEVEALWAEYLQGLKDNGYEEFRQAYQDYADANL